MLPRCAAAPAWRCPINVSDLVAARAAAEPERPALIHCGRVSRYGELLERAEALAGFLAGLNGGGAPRIALHCPNGADYVALALGILRAGACFVPVPAELADAEKSQLLDLTTPQLLIAAGPEPWLPAPARRRRIAGIELAWLEPGRPPAVPEERFAALNPAFVRFSSGTTGSSKGVVIGHASLLARVRSAARRIGLEAGDRVLWTLPMAHHFAVSIMLYLVQGATTVLEDSHLAADLLGTARDSGATLFYGAPFHLALLAAEDSGRDWPTLRRAISTAAALPAATAAAFARRYGKAPLQGLGIIEAGLPLLNTADPAGRPESVGVPDDFEISLRDDGGREVESGSVGELWLRGPGLFDAYLAPWRERPEIAPDGWFASGDLALHDADGFVYLRGRRNSVINCGGMKFFPEEVEAVLNSHPGVHESRVWGQPHDRFGAVALAQVVPADSARPPPPAALARHCRAFLAAYKVPLRFDIVAAIPRTASGKIRR